MYHGARAMDSSALVSVIITCYRRHMSFLEEQLGSWVRYACDAARLPFLVIVSPGERNRFNCAETQATQQTAAATCTRHHHSGGAG